ncbi:MAG: phage tail sheath subtilisin-like domain-containing protein [Campylobacteraceae bacterium]|jgi:phage tail sheath protein FI|nr:phage tail sheath subtilisin-like domain-containing protein [Campylobacteraceae bacterium]
MAAKFGVNVTITAEAARPITIQSITPIGIAGTYSTLETGLHFFGSVTDAKEKLKELAGAGTLIKAVQAICDQAVETPIIFSVFEGGVDTNATITAARTAIEAFKDAKAEFGYRPNLLIAPEFSDVDVIYNALISAAEKLHATAIIDLNSASETLATTKADNFGTRRAIITDPYVKIWDTDATPNAYAFYPQSPFIAGLIARVDGESEYGWSDSYSNRTINGIFGTSRNINFELGEDCEADRLRSNHISTIIRESGFRAWGGETTDQDSIWTDLARVRVFDRISEACQQGVLYAVDKKASELFFAKYSVEQLLQNLTGSKVLIGYNVYWDDKKNTQATVTAGKFYLRIEMQNNPIVKVIELDFVYKDSWSENLLSSINK